jgi:hypothetical protein
MKADNPIGAKFRVGAQLLLRDYRKAKDHRSVELGYSPTDSLE